MLFLDMVKDGAVLKLLMAERALHLLVRLADAGRAARALVVGHLSLYL
jgi:hypothetical protein